LSDPKPPVVVAIGDESFTLPAIATFRVLDRVWPAFVALGKASNVIEQAGAAIRVVSGMMISIEPKLDVDYIETHLRPDQMRPLIAAVEPAMASSGMCTKTAAAPGEAPPAAAGEDRAPVRG
jgi:hypothetical protein